MNYSEIVKNRLKKNALEMTKENPDISGIQEKSSFIFSSIEMSFHKSTYDNICNNVEWKTRLNKPHSHYKDGTLEMQSCNSSDALLMNIFCFPAFLSWKGPIRLLDIDPSLPIEFGWNPIFENENKESPTEIDLKIGQTIFEAKLTESTFTKKHINIVKVYPDFINIFDEDLLSVCNDEVDNYQLIRNIVTADKYKFKFVLLVDEKRIDLIRSFLEIIKAIKKIELKKNLKFITWQELVNNCGSDLSEYINKKYF